MSYTIHDTHRDLQVCPKCGKQALAQPKHNHYRCLWCGFESDVSDTAGRFPSVLLLIPLIAIVIAIAQG